jgi:peptide/nickel transport system permease protein
MGRYIARRLLLSIPVLFGIVLLVFFLTRILPGDTCHALLGERATDAQCAEFNRRQGYDRPIAVQFVDYLGQISRGDLGSSVRTSEPVSALLVERLPTTLELAFFALLFAISVGVPLGIVSAYRRNSAVDVFAIGLANVGVSIPIFVLGLLLAFVFAILLKGTPLALPPSGRLSPGVTPTPIAVAWGLQNLGGLPRGILDFLSNIYTLDGLLTLRGDITVDAFRHLILPAIALGTIPVAIITRITRSSLLDVIGLDYVRTAHAKGLSGRTVIRRHALPTALLPVVTVIGLQIGALLGGAVLTETIFNLAGVGRAVSEAIAARDYAVVQGFVLVVAIGYLIINLVVDVSYGFLDPRIRPS